MSQFSQILAATFSPGNTFIIIISINRRRIAKKKKITLIFIR